MGIMHTYRRAERQKLQGKDIKPPRSDTAMVDNVLSDAEEDVKVYN